MLGNTARPKPANGLHPTSLMVGPDRIVDLRMQVVKLGLICII
ncbi:hypothetical protein PG5_02740 [Pseudomonas sp. G5(2012)]|nr:hypothetical protein PG5_02740 [Pseudomonas sp. G5(2012)]